MLDDSRKWWKCGNARGQVGHVPHTIIIAWQFSEAAAAATQLIPNTKQQQYATGRPAAMKAVR